MSVQIVVYSWTGNSAALAVALQEAMGIEAFLLEEEQDRQGQIGFAKGGFSASINGKTAIKAMPELSADTLVLGMPVWAGTTPPAINTFFEKCSLTGKKVYCFATQMGDSVPKKLEKKLKKRIAAKGGTFVHLFVTQVPKGRQLTVEGARKRAARWAERIRSGE